MVSRTPSAPTSRRYSSQPRSNKGITTPRGGPQLHPSVSTIEWSENVSGNAHHMQFNPVLDRRSRSSTRYQSTGRQSSQRGQRSELPITPTHLRPSRSKADMPVHQRPRPTSASHVRNSEEDPTAVARAIHELRERREVPGMPQYPDHFNLKQSSSRLSSSRRDQSPLAIRPTISGISTGNSGASSPTGRRLLGPTNSGASSPKGRRLETSSSSLSDEEIKANQRLKEAENKISGLLQDLEELKFFQEIEDEKPPVTPKNCAQTPRTPGGGIPPTIRAASPARGGKLPPPPPAQMTEKYRPLSPRKIAKLDRNSLELECQTLARHLQISDDEKTSMKALVDMYEITMKEQEKDSTKVKQLEEELGKLSNELKKQMQNIQKGKQHLVHDYEEKLQQNLKKLHKTQEKADALKAEAQAAKADAEKWKKERDEAVSKASGENTEIDDLKAREKVLELQLTEAQNFAASLQQKFDKKRKEVSGLKEELLESGRAMAQKQEDKDEAYEVKIAALEQQLSLSKDRFMRMEKDCNQAKSSVKNMEAELKLAKVKDAEQASLISDLETQLKQHAEESKAQLEAFKKQNQNKENRRMQDLVREKHDAATEYERRIKALQEQLRHQTDRHHAEIVETNKEQDQKLETMKESIRQEIRKEHDQKVAKLERDLSFLQQSYDEAKHDYEVRLKSAESKEQQSGAEFERQEAARQQELDHTYDRLRSLASDIEERDAKISYLKDQVESQKRSFLEKIRDIEAKHDTDLLDRGKALEDERQQSKTMESKLRAQIEKYEKDYKLLQQSSNAEVSKLRDEIDETHQALLDAQAVSKEGEVIKRRIEEVQNAFSKVQEGLMSERSRHEEVEGELRVEIARLEGRLRASESSLKQKRSRIEQLEDELAGNNKYDTDKMSEIHSLESQLEQAKKRLEEETAKHLEKENLIDTLRREVQSLQDKASMAAQLEGSIQDLESKLSYVEHEKSLQEMEVSKLRKAYQDAETKLMEVEHTHSNRKDENTQKYKDSIRELESKLDDEKIAKKELQTSLRGLQRALDLANDEKARQAEALSNLRSDYDDISSLLEDKLHSSSKNEELDKSLQRKEMELQRTIERFTKNIEDLESERDRKAKEFNNAVERYTAKISELEHKIEMESESTLSLQRSVNQLQESLDRAEAEKKKLSANLAKVKADYEVANRQLEENQERHLSSKDDTEAELSRKDRQIRETIQRYTRTIAELEAKLEEETSIKQELDDKLQSARSELTNKQKQTHELIQRQTRKVVNVENQLEQELMEKGDLKAKLDDVSAELDQKRKELYDATTKLSTQTTELRAAQSQQSEYEAKIKSSREELEDKEKQVNEMKAKIPELLAELSAANREKDDASAKAQRLETELTKKKEQLSQTIERYTETIAELEAQVDEQRSARDSALEKAESARSESTRKDDTIKELQASISDLESKLENANKTKDDAWKKVDELNRDLADMDSRSRELEMQKIELETRLNTQNRAKEDMRGKVSDLTSRLERKEREVREVDDRYRMYVMELESKLDQDSSTKHQLQLNLDKLRNQLAEASGVSSESLALREKLSSLESLVENQRNRAREAEAQSRDAMRDLQEKLESATRAKEDVENALKKVNGEKAEVISALEGVIHEVQNREDEIESLSEMLHKRDEELEHAKIIATKALASAKDIQKRYHDKEHVRNSDLYERMDELNDNIDFLSAKNEDLQQKIASLEKEIRDRNMECKRLKDQLRQIDSNQLGDNFNDFSKQTPNTEDVSLSGSTFSTNQSFSHHAHSPDRCSPGIEPSHCVTRAGSQGFEIETSSFSTNGRNKGMDPDASVNRSSSRGSQGPEVVSQKAFSYQTKSGMGADMETGSRSVSNRARSFGFGSESFNSNRARVSELDSDSFSSGGSPQGSTGFEATFDNDDEKFDNFASHKSNDASENGARVEGDAKGKWTDLDPENAKSSFDSMDGSKGSDGGSGRSRRAFERDALRKYVRKRYLSHSGRSEQ